MGAELLASPERLRAALAADLGLARARPDGARTLLHMLVDWPGHRAGAAELAAILVVSDVAREAARREGFSSVDDWLRAT